MALDYESTLFPWAIDDALVAGASNWGNLDGYVYVAPPGTSSSWAGWYGFDLMTRNLMGLNVVAAGGVGPPWVGVPGPGGGVPAGSFLYSTKGPAQVVPPAPRDNFSDIQTDWVFFRVPVGLKSGAQPQGPKFWGPWATGGAAYSAPPNATPGDEILLHPSSLNLSATARSPLHDPSWRVMTRKGNVVGYSINHIRSDDVSIYMSWCAGARPPPPPPPVVAPTPVDPYTSFPLVVPFIIKGQQADIYPDSGTPPAIPPATAQVASQHYKAAGNLFQPYGGPTISAFPTSYGAHEMFGKEYKEHMAFAPGDLLTVGACLTRTATTMPQNCQVTVYIKYKEE